MQLHKSVCVTLKASYYYFWVGKPCLCAPNMPSHLALRYSLQPGRNHSPPSPYPILYIWCVFFKLNISKLGLYSGVGVKAKSVAEPQ